MPASNRYPAEDLLMNVVHDLRQPLGAIETSAYVLKLLLDDGNSHVLKHLGSIEHQVELAALALTDAVAELRRLRAQRTEAESLDFTNPETAAVT
jgi:signal transduction histidine kinase